MKAVQLLAKVIKCPDTTRIRQYCTLQNFSHCYALKGWGCESSAQVKEHQVGQAFAIHHARRHQVQCSGHFITEARRPH